MIDLVVIFCMTINPTMCRTMPMVPDDGHEIASIGECLRGGAIGGMTFVLEHTEWQVRGWRCIEKPPTDFQQWLSQKDIQ